MIWFAAGLFVYFMIAALIAALVARLAPKEDEEGIVAVACTWIISLPVFFVLWVIDLAIRIGRGKL